MTQHCAGRPSTSRRLFGESCRAYDAPNLWNLSVSETYRMQSTKSLFSGNPANACSTYRYILDSKKSTDRAGREHCEELWNEYRSFADPHFLEEFPLHTHQRWFEMYLTVSLIRAGLNVECSKLKKRGAPDVLITDDDRKIWIEAVCPTAGTEGKPDSVPDPLHKLWHVVVTQAPAFGDASARRSSLYGKCVPTYDLPRFTRPVGRMV